MPNHLGKAIAAGALAGLAGSVFLRAWMTAASYLHEDTPMPDTDGPAHQVGALTVQKLTGYDLNHNQRLVVGEVVHYAFGAFTGGIYGILAEYQPWTTAGAGLLFGTGVFLAADESSMPLLHLVPLPWTEKPIAQFEHWAAHLIYGVSTELVRQRLRSRL